MDGVGEALIVVDGVVDLGAIDDDGGGVGGGVVDVDGFGLWAGQSPNAMHGVSRFEISATPISTGMAVIVVEKRNHKPQAWRRERDFMIGQEGRQYDERIS
jgi:hypothetical protein